MNEHLETRSDLVEPGDRTALVCIDHPEMQRSVIGQLDGLGYKIHTGAPGDDLATKLNTHIYHVIVTWEHFADCDGFFNPLLLELNQQPTSLRRRQFVVLIGPNLATGDALLAFRFSVNLVVASSEANSIAGPMRRAMAVNAEAYMRFTEVLNAVGMA